jgi:hypothetical protein
VVQVQLVMANGVHLFGRPLCRWRQTQSGEFRDNEATATPTHLKYSWLLNQDEQAVDQERYGPRLAAKTLQTGMPC